MIVKILSMKRLNRARKYRRRRRILYTVILLITAGVIALGFNFKRFQMNMIGLL